MHLKLWTNGNIERQGALLWTGRTSTRCLCSLTDPFAFSTVLPLLERLENYHVKPFYFGKPYRTRNFFLEIILRP